MGRALIAGPDIPGLVVQPDAITEAREAEIVRWIEEVPPESCGGRHRLDLYGDGPFVRTSVGRKLSTEIPPILAELALALYAELPDSVTVSEYLFGQGVKQHIDRAEAGPAIRTLSLLGDADLVFRHHDGGELSLPTADLPSGKLTASYKRYRVRFPARALVTFRDPCRSAPWTHELAEVIGRRISIAFRRAG